MNRWAIRFFILLIITALFITLWRLGVFSFDWSFEPENNKVPFSVPTSQFLPIDCGSVCDKLSQCDIEEYFENCMDICPPFYSQPIRECVMESNCEYIRRDCFSKESRLPDCREACEIVADCDVMEFGRCVKSCKDWDENILDCVHDADCGQMAYQCFSPDPVSDCVPFCDRLLECGQMDFSMENECLDICSRMSRKSVDCVLNSDCKDIDPWCFGPDPKPSCPEYCHVLSNCRYYDLDGYSSCMADCQFEPETIIECVADSDCFSIDFCYQNPGRHSDCEDYCHRLVDCDFYDSWDYLDCWKDCREESVETVMCVMEKSCHNMSFCFSNNYLADCENVCLALKECGGEENFEDCLFACVENWPGEGDWDFEDYPYSHVDDWCQDNLLQEQCRVSCKKLRGCPTNKYSRNCEENCFLERWSNEKLVCLNNSSCEKIVEDCFSDQ